MNFRFFNRNCLVEHEDPRLCMALSVSITFEFQKNDERNDTVTMHRTGDSYMCPVVAWAAVIQRILSYPGTGPTTTVNTMYDPDTGTFSYLTSDDLQIHLQIHPQIHTPNHPHQRQPISLQAQYFVI